MAALKIASGVHEAVQRLPDGHALTPAQLSALATFTKDPAEYYDQKAEKKASYSPASATIQGILKDMYDTFSTSLERGTETEATQQKNYETIMAVKKKEMMTLTTARTATEAFKADSEKQLADSTQELDATQVQLKENTALFDETKAACESSALMWQ